MRGNELNWGFHQVDRLLHGPESGLCRLKCPHRTTVTAETMENLVLRKSNVSTFRAHKATISSRVQKHKLVDQNTVRATRLFDHGWLLGGGLAQKQSDLTLELLKQCSDAILRSTSSTGRVLVVDGQNFNEPDLRSILGPGSEDAGAATRT
jgi:hypothetical protein